MWIWRKMEKISWTAKVSNAEVLNRVKENSSIINTINQQKRTWLGHVLRHDVLLRDILEGRIVCCWIVQLAVSAAKWQTPHTGLSSSWRRNLKGGTLLPDSLFPFFQLPSKRARQSLQLCLSSYSLCICLYHFNWYLNFCRQLQVFTYLHIDSINR